MSYAWVKRGELIALNFFFEAQISFRSHQATLTLLQEDSGCGAVVERTPHNREVVGLIPAGCWAFFSFRPQYCVLKQVPQGGAA